MSGDMSRMGMEDMSERVDYFLKIRWMNCWCIILAYNLVYNDQSANTFGEIRL